MKLTVTSYVGRLVCEVLWTDNPGLHHGSSVSAKQERQKPAAVSRPQSAYLWALLPTAGGYEADTGATSEAMR